MAQISRLRKSLGNRIKTSTEPFDPREFFPPQPGKQTTFYESPADITIYGGAAGAGKSRALLIKAAKYIDVPGYGAVLFRRSTGEITIQGGLWDESQKLYSLVSGARSRESRAYLDWQFPAGSAISFEHSDRLQQRIPGAQIAYIGIDELTKFNEKDFWFLFSRNRSTCGVAPKVDATCNPDADSWVAKLVEWWIDPLTGYPIEKRSGVLRYFYRINEVLHWGDTPEELEQKFPDLAAIAPPKSFTFIPGTVYDNPALLKANPQYLSNLLSLHPVEVERLLKGNWKIRFEAGTIFNRKWFKIITEEQVPTYGNIVRFWDFAATSRDFAGTEAYYTASVKMLSVQDLLIILHCTWEQIGASEGEDTVVTVAESDGFDVSVRWEREGGSSGKWVEASLQEALSGYDAEGILPQGDKLTRAIPLARHCKNKGCYLLEGDWNDTFIDLLHNWDGKRKPLVSDVIDAGSGAYTYLMNLYYDNSWLNS